MSIKEMRLKNKVNWSLIITLLLVLISFFLFLYINLTKAISKEKFIDISTKYGLKIKDIKDNLETDKVINTTIAYNKYGYFQIEFIEFTNNDNAIDAFELNKSSFEGTENVIDKELKDQKYKTTYTMNTKDYYMSIIRKSNTLVYVKIPTKYKKEVLKFLKKIKY